MRHRALFLAIAAAAAALLAAACRKVPPEPLYVVPDVEPNVLIFNGERDHLVSVHRALEGAAFLDDLTALAAEREVSALIAIDWFGDPAAPPPRLELLVGADVPVPLAQVVIAAAADSRWRPLVVSQQPDDGDFGNRARVYVGSLRPTDNPETAPEALRRLRSPGVADDVFWSLLPEAGR